MSLKTKAVRLLQQTLKSATEKYQNLP